MDEVTRERQSESGKIGIHIATGYCNPILWLMAYVFVGAGFPMHRDRIWSIVRPL
jgi:hypothetical protein